MHLEWSEITSAKVTRLLMFAAAVSIFKEASGQGYVRNKVELVSLACEDGTIQDFTISIEIFIKITTTHPVTYAQTSTCT